MNKQAGTRRRSACQGAVLSTLHLAGRTLHRRFTSRGQSGRLGRLEGAALCAIRSPARRPCAPIHPIGVVAGARLPAKPAARSAWHVVPRRTLGPASAGLAKTRTRGRDYVATANVRFVDPLRRESCARRPRATSPMAEHARAPLGRPLRSSCLARAGARASRLGGGPDVSDRHISAKRESAYSGQLSLAAATAGIGIYRPAQSRHKPATA